ncbi:hypothetical protein PHJA_002573500 [Phtheirospermum japonicum]|uniref:Uncharacterized protein n=1 Tax=Phtheirospermum japonicum TaxID=374723 RepID=A0A830DB42_9LAMI|nr:hypothetical protein PHJA_002573500 [Phtheirospermum japonicum]
MERGPRFKEYSAQIQSALRKENRRPAALPPVAERSVKLTTESFSMERGPRFSSYFTTPPKRSKIPSALTQSVTNFSSALRKVNRRPAALALVVERSTPSPSAMLKSGRMYGKVGGGSKSTNSAEKRSGGGLIRKSYAIMDELKKLGVLLGKKLTVEKEEASTSSIVI